MPFETGNLYAAELTDWPGTGVVTVYDTEFTAWEGSQARNWSEPWEATELIEIGAVRVDGATFELLDRFRILVLPRKNPALSAYITGLTGIDQARMDAEGVALTDAVGKFIAFTETSVLVMANGGDADVFVESYQCHGLSCPMDFTRFRNMQPAFRRLFNLREDPGSADLPALAGIHLDFKAHEALEDARAIAAAMAALRTVGKI